MQDTHTDKTCLVISQHCHQVSSNITRQWTQWHIHIFFTSNIIKTVKTIHTMLLRDRYVMHKHDRLTRIGSEEKDKIQIDSVNNSLTVVEEGDMANDRLVGTY